MSENRSIQAQTMVVILAAGKGTRMGRSDLVKVCFEIDSVPAINRQLTVFKKLGFRRFLLVVGTMAEQVLQTVDREHPGLISVYQHDALGTGHAAKIAAEAIQSLDYEGHVLVTAGDAHIEPEAIQTLIDGYVKQQADMAVLMADRQPSASSTKGRVLVETHGHVLDIIESVDLSRQAVADHLQKLASQRTEIAGNEIIATINKHIPHPDKQQAAVGALLKLVRNGDGVAASSVAQLVNSDAYNIQIDGKRYTASEIEKTCKGTNQSVYLFRSDVFYEGVGMIDNNNAQGEYYLTDVVRHLSSIRDAAGQRKYRVRAVPNGNADWVQSFNSPDELLAVQDYVRRAKMRHRGAAITGKNGTPQLKPSQFATVSRWLQKLEAQKPAMRRWLRKIYGPNEPLHAEKQRDLRSTLECYGKQFGFEEKVCIVRAPGRINLMGRHVDHRGGNTNFLAIHRETIAVAGFRDDNNVMAVNTEPKKFAPVEFSIPELIGRFAWSDWLDFVDSNWVRNMLYAAPGDWGHYVKAALLRLQHRFRDVKVPGLNMALSGNVPIAAGLSSSSTIVVATLQAAIALSGFELTSHQFIDLCGEGEWFVGSRGGAGDHAAIYLGQRGKIAHVGYLPFRVNKVIDAPEDYRVIIGNSHVKAAKSAAAKQTFNARVADYNLGFALLKQRCPQIAGAAEYLRDINPDNLGCASSDIYRMLLKIPERISRSDFESALTAEHQQLLETNFATHAAPECYRPRGVLLYGIAEIMRGKMCIDMIENGQADMFGQMMKLSHDGDRVSRVGTNGEYEPFMPDCSDAHLQILIGDLASEDPQRVLQAQLYMQPGAYACSTPEIDKMVDIASSVPGVVGAQIAGAGLGGCIMVLAREDAVDAVRKALVTHYYRPAGLKPDVLPCIAVEGAGLADF